MFTGFISGTRVAGVVTLLWDALPTFCKCIVRSIDSTRMPRELDAILRYHGVTGDLMNDNVCLSPEKLHEVLRKGVFTGFDELWFTREERPGSMIHVPALTSDAQSLSDRVPPGLEQMMQESRTYLALGDGCGLNYATTEQRLVWQLRRMGVG